MLVGLLVGLASAYFGRWVDNLLSLVTNVFLLLPGLPLLVILAAFLPPGLGTVILVLVITGWAGRHRVLRLRRCRSGARTSSGPRHGDR